MNCYIKSTDYNGFAIEMASVSLGNCEDFMSKHNLTIDWTDNEGCNLLIYAIQFEALGIIFWLINKGIDVNHRDNDWKNFYDYVKESTLPEYAKGDLINLANVRPDIKSIVKKASEKVRLESSIVNSNIRKHMNAVYDVMLECGVSIELVHGDIEDSALDLSSSYLYLFNIGEEIDTVYIEDVQIYDEGMTGYNKEHNTFIVYETDCGFMRTLIFGNEFWDLEKVREIVTEHMDMCRLNEKDKISVDDVCSECGKETRSYFDKGCSTATLKQ